MKEVICYVRMIMMNDSDELTLRPTEDYAFKRLFGWEDGKKSLIYSLYFVQILDIQLLSNFRLPY